GARPYDPSVGRFVSSDPIEGGSINNYDFAGQDPLNATDLSGQSTTINAGCIASHPVSYRGVGVHRRVVGGGAAHPSGIDPISGQDRRCVQYRHTSPTRYVNPRLRQRVRQTGAWLAANAGTLANAGLGCVDGAAIGGLIGAASFVGEPAGIVLGCAFGGGL